MFKLVFPCEYVNSLGEIDFDRLYGLGYRGLLFDIDNTLVPFGKNGDGETFAFLNRLKETGFSVALISDNSEERVRAFLGKENYPYICDARKPRKKGFVSALELLGTKPSETVAVGDQMFLDILGANRCGIPGIMVRYPDTPGETDPGIRRKTENAVLRIWRGTKYEGRLFNPRRRKLFCEISPLTFELSTRKEIIKRHIKNLLSDEKTASEQIDYELPVVISDFSSHLIKRAPGVDLSLQEGKAVNIGIAGGKINRMLIRPGETFSFWRTVGKVTKRKGYRDGRVLRGSELMPGIGGGLCNLANAINNLVLRSPLEITEFNTHSDALAPDEGKRVPLSAGTSVCYNYLDYRFRNNTDRDVQLCVWCENETLRAQLRTTEPFDYDYELSEENHCFHKEGDRFYRMSQIYQDKIEKASGKITEHKLILDNKSEVLFDYSLIPGELIR